MHDSERRTRHLFLHTVADTDRTSECRLPRPKIAIERNDQWWIDLATEPLSPAHQLRLCERQLSFGNERWQQLVARHFATFNSNSWSRSVAASSKSILAAASFICSSSIRTSAWWSMTA